MSLPEGWEFGDAFSLGIDGLATARKVLAPIGDQAPLNQVERALSCFVVLADYKQFLTGAL
jgi:hypothetical protein